MKMSKFNDTYNKIISEMAEKKLLKENEDKEDKEKDEIVNEDDMGGDDGGDIGGDDGGDM